MEYFAPKCRHTHSKPYSTYESGAPSGARPAQPQDPRRRLLPAGCSTRAVFTKALVQLELVAADVDSLLYDELRRAYVRQSAAAARERQELAQAHTRKTADNLAALEHARHALDSVVRDLQTLHATRDALGRGTPADTADRASCHSMIPLQEELLAEWRLHLAEIERRMMHEDLPTPMVQNRCQARTGASALLNYCRY